MNVLIFWLFIAPIQQVVASGVCAGAASACPSSDNVLLQQMHLKTRIFSKAETMASPVVMCETCASVFKSLGGCEAVKNEDFVAIGNVHARPEFAGCEQLDCDAQLQARCGMPLTRAMEMASPVLTCATCNEVFESLGGCEALKKGGQGAIDKLHARPELAGCEQLDCDAQRHSRCSSSVDESTERAADEERAKAEEHRAAEEKAKAVAAAVEAEECRTASPGDPCFERVRWAMERGIDLHPEWYPVLTRTSSFEQFQELLHARDAGGCPRPCAMQPESSCHTATSGEECHRHAVWAKDFGIRTLPETYPKELTSESPLTEFQAWLHRIHHGDCPAPCPESDHPARS